MPVGKKDSSTEISVSAGTGDSAARQHTPGPWKFNDVCGCKEIRGDKYPPHRQGQYRGIASTHGLADDDEDRANARLIAAAHDMHAALTNFVALIADWRVTGKVPDFASLLIAQNAGQDALSKAEGR